MACFDDNASFDLTDRGRSVVLGEEKLLITGDQPVPLSAEILNKALSLLRSPGFYVRPASLGQLVEALEKKQRVAGEVARRHVMWLLKQGLVRLAR